MILNNDRRTATLLVGARAVKRFNIDPGETGKGKQIVWTVIFQWRWKGGYALAIFTKFDESILLFCRILKGWKNVVRNLTLYMI